MPTARKSSQNKGRTVNNHNPSNRLNGSDAAQDGEGQDNVRVFAAPDVVADQIGDIPEEVDSFAVVHSSRIVHPPRRCMAGT